MRQSVVAEAIAAKAEALIGKEVAALFNDNPEEFVAKESKVSEAWVSGAIRERYLSLKERAWANLLRSANVEDKLSSAAQKRMRAAFDEIKTLEFTVENIHAFLRGLVESQGEIFREMACDVFDLITRYHTDNVVFYKGWASNDRHRSCGMRLKKTRFVLPGNLSYAGSNSLSYEASQRLRDFDKVLSVLDGKSGPEVSIESLFGKQGWEKLSQGERLSSTYMDIRFYPRAGTIHFFPRSQALMDKLNMLVGLQRQRAGAGDAVVVVQPLLRDGRVRDVLLVQDLEAGPFTGQRGQHGIGAGARQARVQHLDHHVNVLDAFGDGFFGQVHVTGEPLDGHAGSFLFVQFRQRRQG